MSETIKFGKLDVEIKEEDQKVTYTFNGDVDENFKQTNLPRISAQTIIFELEHVDNFNSCGIREWIYLIKDFSKLGKLIFRNCSINMIDQVNMVPDSANGAKIESFFAPYYCETETCEGEVNRMIVVENNIDDLTSGKAPEFTCEKCSKPLDFDALEGSYFLFIENDKSTQQAS
jgi:hypothetical protein